MAIGENADPSVRVDLENYFTNMVDDKSYFTNMVDDKSYFTHTFEGSDDMPAHIKSIVIGTSLSIPITNGICNLGSWQGIYLCEHRNHADGREIVMTIMGE